MASHSLSYLDKLYGRLGGGMKLGLDRTERFMDYLNNPERTFPSIHVAGTNGKGSVVALIAKIFETLGYKTGRFTSPHLVDFNERMSINGINIPNERIGKYLGRWKDFLDKEEISFFEITTGLAFKYFSDEKVDIAIVETGLGGRLDSTNVLNPEVSVITKIDKDHTRILGSTLAQIAGEKAGIIKKERPLVTLKQTGRVLDVLQAVCVEKKAKLHIEDSKKMFSNVQISETMMSFDIRGYEQSFSTSLQGEHQLQNIALCLKASSLYLKKPIPGNSLTKALKTVYWPGRFEKISAHPTVIYDVAHNLGGVKKLLALLKKIYPGTKFHFVIGMLKDKQFKDIFNRVSAMSDSIYLSTVNSHRSYSKSEIRDLINIPKERVFASVNLTLKQCTANANTDDVICIFGSHYIAREVYSFFE